jgi:CHAT domain-containing protein/Tfp pilus assembly protein PilF
MCCRQAWRALLLVAISVWAPGLLSSYFFSSDDELARAQPLVPQPNTGKTQPAIDSQLTAEQQQHLWLADPIIKEAKALQSQGKYKEAIPKWEQVCEIVKNAAGEKHTYYAAMLSNLSSAYNENGEYAKSELLDKQALAIDREALGTKHPDYAVDLNNLAQLYVETGNYAKAEPLYMEALGITKAALGQENASFAYILYNLAGLYHAQGNYSQAIPLYQECLRIREKVLGIDHRDVAACLNNLATLYEDQGNFVEAHSLLERALKIKESMLGPEHADTAVSIHNLATLYRLEGNYSEAQPLFQAAIKIWVKTLGPGHPNVASGFDNLALVYRAKGDFDEALSLLQRALEIRENAYGPNNPRVAESFNDLAGLYLDQEKYGDALPLFQRALKIREQSLGPEHPEVANSLNNLGGVCLRQGKFDEALPLFKRALQIDLKALGPDHPDVAIVVNNLACLYRDQADYANALPFFQRSADATIHLLELSAAGQSERQQLENIKTGRGYLDSFISCALLSAKESRAGYKELSDAAYTQVLAWKGAVTMRQLLAHVARHGEDPEEIKMWNDLQAVTAQLAILSRSIPSSSQHDAWQKKLSELTHQKEQLEANLSKCSAEYRKLRSQTRLTPNELAKKLPAGTALIDVLQFDRQVDERQSDGTFKRHWESRLAAFVVRADQPVAMIDLGLVAQINQTVQHWRETYGDNLPKLTSEEQPAMKMRHLIWDPIADHMDGIKTILVSPDGEVAKFPWSALPGSKPNSYLIEDGTSIALIPVPQMLPNLLDDKKSTSEQKIPTLLVVGDVDYDALPADPQLAKAEATSQPKVLLAAAEHRSAVRGEQGMIFGPLPGTAQEIQDIENVYRARFRDGQPLELKQSAATQTRLRQEAPKYCYLHLATHGFFAPPTVHSALAQDQQSSQALQMSQEQQVVGFNPGLLAGIALSGANLGNRRESSTAPIALPADDGIMTALEVASLDLQNTDLVTLSACETGLGQSTRGEGMLGLQRAFQVAGAKTTISSLWSVDDTATQALMVEFYKRLWDKDHPMGKLEALRQAQLEMLQRYDPKTKKLVDRGRGLELDAESPTISVRLSPKYWAAFELSGDWR